MAIDAYYGFLSTVFGPILGFHPAIAITAIAAFITLVTAVFYKLLIDQNKAKEIREKVKDLQKQAKEAQKTDPEKAKEFTSQMLSLTNKQLSMSMKPMLVMIVFILLIFPWLRSVFASDTIILPLSIFGKSTLGWFWWYFLATLPLSSLFRKALGVM